MGGFRSPKFGFSHAALGIPSSTLSTLSTGTQHSLARYPLIWCGNVLKSLVLLW